MDKNTLSNYGWIVVLILILSVMLALATPFGNFIARGFEASYVGFDYTANEALGTVIGLENGDTGDTETGITDNNGTGEYYDSDLEIEIYNTITGATATCKLQDTFDDYIANCKAYFTDNNGNTTELIYTSNKKFKAEKVIYDEYIKRITEEGQYIDYQDYINKSIGTFRLIDSNDETIINNVEVKIGESPFDDDDTTTNTHFNGNFTSQIPIAPRYIQINTSSSYYFSEITFTTENKEVLSLTKCSNCSHSYTFLLKGTNAYINDKIKGTLSITDSTNGTRIYEIDTDYKNDFYNSTTERYLITVSQNSVKGAINDNE